MQKYIGINGDLLLTIVDNKVIEGQIVGVIMEVIGRDVCPKSYNFLHNGEVINLPYEQSFFDGYDEFRENTPIKPTETETYLYKLTEVYSFYKWNHSKESIILWRFDSKPIEYYWWDSIKSYEIGKGVVTLLDGFLPKLYADQEECLYWNDIVIHRDNGTIDVKDAGVKKLLLNDTQKEIFGRFKEIVKEMSDARMLILIDSETDTVSVVNEPKGNWSDCCSNGVCYSGNEPIEQVVKMRQWIVDSEFRIEMNENE